MYSNLTGAVTLPGIGEQLAFLFILGLPIASIAWTITHEDIFREVHDWCKHNSESCSRLYKRKFFYLFTCEYCFSHYVAVLFLIVTRFRMLYSDWRGYLISGFALVWVANVYMNLYSRVRLDIKRERVEIAAKENQKTEQEPSPALVVPSEALPKTPEPDHVRQ
ncbi:MAG: hypothetical protein JOY62_02060 [Acidobacteriaceae bacterium]|nr:hypothetical protein [Acidobacteriaceae bacterium]MBV9778732.1 hypothetical protein [Acidobacteriaceae bacterium]